MEERTRYVEKENRKVDFSCPAIVKLYNGRMGDVDLMDICYYIVGTGSH